MERNQFISLAHVNPKCFEQKLIKKKDESENGSNENISQLCSMWFIGLDFERTENLNVDLTENIQSFTDSVHKHAVSFICLGIYEMNVITFIEFKLFFFLWVYKLI